MTLNIERFIVLSLFCLATNSMAGRVESVNPEKLKEIPEGYELDSILNVFPNLPRYSIRVRASKSEVVVNIVAVGRFPDGALNPVELSDFAQSFGYSKLESDQLKELDITFDKPRCVYDPKIAAAVGCVFKTTDRNVVKKLILKGSDQLIDLTSNITGYFHGGLAIRATHGATLANENVPYLHYSLRLSAVGTRLNGEPTDAVLELIDQAIYAANVNGARNP